MTRFRVLYSDRLCRPFLFSVSLLPSMSLLPAKSQRKPRAIPLSSLELVEDPNDPDSEPTPENFHWSSWLQKSELQEDEKLVKRIVHLVLEDKGLGVAGRVADGQPRMKDFVGMLADKYKKSQEEVFVWICSGPGQPFDLLFELRDGLKSIAKGTAGEDDVARVIARRLTTPQTTVFMPSERL